MAKIRAYQKRRIEQSILNSIEIAIERAICLHETECYTDETRAYSEYYDERTEALGIAEILPCGDLKIHFSVDFYPQGERVCLDDETQDFKLRNSFWSKLANIYKKAYRDIEDAQSNAKYSARDDAEHRRDLAHSWHHR